MSLKKIFVISGIVFAFLILLMTRIELNINI